jgi:hypothetical protein
MFYYSGIIFKFSLNVENLPLCGGFNTSLQNYSNSLDFGIINRIILHKLDVYQLIDFSNNWKMAVIIVQINLLGSKEKEFLIIILDQSANYYLIKK